MNASTIEPLKVARWRLLPVLDRMLTQEIFRTAVTVLAVLVTIIVSKKFLNVLTKAIEGEVAAETLFILLGLKMLSATIILLPPAVFLAMLMVFGRMYRDQEMSILAASGVGLLRLYRAVALLLIPLSILAGYLALQVMPWSERVTQELMRKDEETADVRGIKPGRFNEFSRGDVVLYATATTDNNENLSDVFVQSRDGEKTGIVVAATGYLKEAESGEHYVVLKSGKRYQGVPGQADFVISEFDEYAVKIEDESTESAALKREAMPSEQLFQSKAPRQLAELLRRLSVPFGTFTLSLLALPLSRVAPRGGVYGNVLTAFLIYIIYENLQKVSQGMLIQGKIPFWLSFSSVYLVMFALIAFYLLRSLGLRWLFESTFSRKAP